MKTSLLVLVFLPLINVLYPPAAAQQFTVSGYVEDAGSGERLVGATLYAPEHAAGAVTNTYGFFSLSLPPGTVTLRVSYVGYLTDTLIVALDRDVTMVLELQPVPLQLGEVEVTAGREAAVTGISSIRVPIEQVQRIPALAGETDLLKALQLLPGVKSGTEGTGGLYVRGGGQDQNLILLDGTPVFNANHLFGFLSVFNTDAIKHVELIKGGFPARYGGRLSSVLEITMKEGNMKQTAVEGAIGLITSRLTVEAPIRKDRTSFMISGRRTYFDVLMRPLIDLDDGKPTAYFYDLSAKVNHILSPRDRLYLSVYAGEDRFGGDFRSEDQESRSRLWWGNTTGALRWNRLWNPMLFMNTTLTYSDYGLNVSYRETFRSGSPDVETTGARYVSGIDAFGARSDVDWVPSPSHYARFGAGATAYTFSPGALHYSAGTLESALDAALGSQSVDGVEVSVYAEDDVRIGPDLKVNAGLHASGFFVEGRAYGSLQPRLSAQYLLGSRWIATGSFATMQQPIHLLVHTSGLGLPTDLWVPSTGRVRPQKSWQAALGVSGFLPGDRYELALEGYYKRMDRIIAYHEGASFLTPGTDWQDLVTAGKGWSYGVEVLLRRSVGRTTGWIGYTLARSMRQFDEIGNGLSFPDRYDRRHDVSLVASRRMSPRLDLSIVFVYATGNAVTLPLATFSTLGHQDPLNNRLELVLQPQNFYGDRRNAFRLPAYHRLDLSATYFFIRREGRESALALSIYNAYNRKNPFYLELQRTSEQESGTRLKGYAIFPVLPSISYRFKF